MDKPSQADRPRVATAADIVNRTYTFEEVRQRCENAYRRGVHQALAFAYGESARAHSLADARDRIGRAEDAACELRNHDRDAGYLCLLDEVRRRMGRRRP